MKGSWSRLRQCLAIVLLPIALFLAACDSDSTEPRLPEYSEVAVVMNSIERSLSIIPIDEPGSAFTIGVSPEGTPVDVAVRDEIAVVPLGTYPFVAVVDLVEGEVVHTVALPEGSGATGAAFLNDSIAIVGNPGRNSVSPVNVLRGTAGDEIEVGVYPESLIGVGREVYVFNSKLDENWTPAEPGSITVIGADLEVERTIELSGYNPGAAVVGTDGRLYVLNSGSFGLGNGSLSVVDPVRGVEVEHYEGFGDFPGSITWSPRGTVLVGVYEAGIVEWDPSNGGSFIRGLDDPLTPGDTPPVAGIGFDSRERLFVLNPGYCLDPGVAHILSADGEPIDQVTIGVCPMELAFTELPETR